MSDTVLGFIGYVVAGALALALGAILSERKRLGTTRASDATHQRAVRQ